MTKLFMCERDGYLIRGTSDDELLAQVEGHIAGAHPDLLGTFRATGSSRTSARRPRLSDVRRRARPAATPFPGISLARPTARTQVGRKSCASSR
jgi:hypothetical protein